MTASRIKGNRLTVSKDKKGKLLYSKVVSKQTLQGVHHLFEVCEGSFGKTLPTKWEPEPKSVLFVVNPKRFFIVVDMQN